MLHLLLHLPPNCLLEYSPCKWSHLGIPFCSQWVFWYKKHPESGRSILSDLFLLFLYLNLKEVFILYWSIVD